ncbi:hypothetical protein BX600DRAFT_475284 [Xylariales sp. PMI_506]|nr:hypothetical protein BX600DRAFT_475284 [Xylariales sp. PMI_506]
MMVLSTMRRGAGAAPWTRVVAAVRTGRQPARATRRTSCSRLRRTLRPWVLASLSRGVFVWGCVCVCDLSKDGWGILAGNNL